MPFLHLAQDPTAVSDAAVVEVVQQATEAIDAFSNLGVFMAVLFVIALLIIFFGAIVLVVVWSNRNSSNISLTTLAQVAADKAKENEALNLRDQQWRDQFLATLAVLSGKQTDITTGLSSSEQTVKQAITSSEGRVIAKVDASKEDVLAVLRLLGRVNTDVFQPVSSEPPDLAAMQIILEDTLKAIESAKKRMSSAPPRSHTAATPAAAADEPAEVTIADISPAAVDTIKHAMTGDVADSEESEAA